MKTLPEKVFKNKGTGKFLLPVCISEKGWRAEKNKNVERYEALKTAEMCRFLIGKSEILYLVYYIICPDREVIITIKIQYLKRLFKIWLFSIIPHLNKV